MPSLEDIPRPENGFYVLITGANSGLGLAIGCRLIDEFLHTRPQDQSLVLITTTRDQRKSDATVEKLRQHLQKVCGKVERSVPGMSMLLQRRVHLRPEQLNLTSIISIQELSRRLRRTTPKLDVIICNAGIGGWVDLYWGRAVWSILTDWKNETTWPTFKKSGVGWETKPQIPAPASGARIQEPPMGEVFCANFFGHYLLGHYLAPLLARHSSTEQTRGRLIWVSSLDAFTHTLKLDDIQSIKSSHPYESSKRLGDVVGITSTLPSSAPVVDQYLDHAADTHHTTKPRIYVSHPGICGTSIFPLSPILDFCFFVAMYVSRWLGSMWHPVTAEKAACAMVWLTLANQRMLDSMEVGQGVGKWGSATDWWGQERVERTEVDGWGWGGRLDESTNRKGRSPFAKDLTKEDKEQFEETGRKCWEELEKLRIEWEQRLDEAGVGVKMED
ncbi:3-keto-steroid reductase [Lophiostoma macrostomum CBS 122681]|uniref:3-keto-steroid reductase n=1 Tax=Lophiostoma macrostomum CBS 122681 TaxID=1314788 RepID=A0A6A6T7L9_9PLEO|nr:3-keto-steroid reductase [Lophiostoma macrostomum CBS 122681]